MRLLTATVLSALLSGTVMALAQQISGYDPPPPQYDHTPAIPVIEHVLSLEEVTKICSPFLRPLQPGEGWLGCAIKRYENGKFISIIYRIDDDRVRRHEIGHTNGWPADHSNPEIKQATAPLLKTVELAPWPVNADGVTETQKRAQERYKVEMQR